MLMSRLTARLAAALLTLTAGLAAVMPRAANRPHPTTGSQPQSVGQMKTDKPAERARPSNASPKLYPVWLNGKTGFIDNTGKLVIPAKFDSNLFMGRIYSHEGAFADGMARISVYHGQSPRTAYPIYQHGYIDSTGQVVIPPQFEEAEDFSEGLAAVKISTWREGYNTTKDRYGYIDKTGRMVIPARFYVAGRFSEGLANVCEEEAGCGYIDHTGRMVLPLQFSGLGRFRDGVATVLTTEGKDAIIDKTGRLIYEGRFPSLPSRVFYEDLAAVLFSDKTGFIDKRGRVVIKPVYDSAGGFSDGLAVVKVNGKYGYIDKSGAMVIEPQFDFASSFSEGLAVIGQDGKRGYHDRKYGYIDKSGRIVIRPQFYLADSLSEGMAAVEVQDRQGRVICGYIDTTGRMAISPRFHEAYEFSGGIARVKPTVDRIGYIDKTGKYVWRPSR
jgi:hypothetical protein